MKLLREHGAFILAALALAAFVALSMALIPLQLADVADPAQKALFAQNVLALAALVILGSYLMRVGLTGERPTLPPQNTISSILVALLATGFICGVIFVFLALSGVETAKLFDNYLVRLGAWYALFVIGAAIIFLGLALRDRTLWTEAELTKLTAQLENTLLTKSPRGPKTIEVKSVSKVDFVPIADIRYVTTARNYVELHLARKTYLHRASLKAVMDELTPAGFVQIHRTAAVNIAELSQIRNADGVTEVVLHDSTRLPVGPAFKKRLAERLSS